VKHILIECVDLNDVLNKYFVVTSMKDLFENVASQNIVDFIKETHFYEQLLCLCINVCYLVLLF